ncbi:MAG: hypothetical protein LUE64_06845 [Candidatus Gastranaerophilales bacterium]|nr:hypothetical protein [Candidatus Gastranaerophilales bacterium]
MRNFYKKFISLAIIFAFISGGAFAEPLKGSVSENERLIDNEMFTGEIDRLDSKDTVKMTVSHVINGAINEEGDEFFAEITEDVSGKTGVIIPKGSIVHGVIQLIQDPKKLNRNGYIITAFDYLVTPDGRQIPIQGNLSTKENLAKGTIKNVAQHTGVALATGALGGLMSINLFGLEAAITSHGMTVAGGAAIGGAIGLVSMLNKKGNTVNLKPGDEFEIKMLGEIDLPVFSENAFREDDIYITGLNVDIMEAKYTKDPFGDDNFIMLNLKIVNDSDMDFYPFDIALMDDVKKIYYPSPFSDNDIWFKTIKSGERVAGKISFSITSKKNKHWLIFMDRSTKKPVAKYSIESMLAKKQKGKKHS